VIILSVIGGAINMTRQVPSLQREGEYSDVGYAKGRIENWLRKMPLIGKYSKTTAAEPEKTLEDARETASEISPVAPESMKPPEIAEELNKLVAEQTARRKITSPTMKRVRVLVARLQELFAARKEHEPLILAECESYEDWLSSQQDLKELLGQPWRVQLLNQYMYLISAPFLAIVAYYMLELLGLSTKQPILVLISFSVGLISEKILKWLLGLASGYLRGEVK